MKSMNETLRSYIRRVIKEEIDLGKVAFGGERKDKVPFEEDTPSETKLLQSIIDYLDGTKQLTNVEIDAIKKWLSSDEYSDMFAAPTAEKAFRSVSMSYEQLSKVTGLSSDEISAASVGSITKRGSAEKEFTIVSRGGGITSWSTSLSAALHFGRAEIHRRKMEGHVIVVFEATTGDNDGSMLDLDAIYNKVDHPLMIDRFMEREIWGLGPIKCNRVRWYEAF